MVPPHNLFFNSWFSTSIDCYASFAERLQEKEAICFFLQSGVRANALDGAGSRYSVLRFGSGWAVMPQLFDRLVS
jgi:hypothetical protein